MLLRPARRPQSGISLWSLFLSVLSVSLMCTFVLNCDYLRSNNQAI